MIVSRPHARARQSRNLKAAQRAATDDGRMRPEQSLLPRLAEAREQDLARIALSFRRGHPKSRPKSMVTKWLRAAYVMMGKVRPRFAGCLTTLGLACAVILSAQTATYEGRRIAGIQFVPPDQPLTAKEIEGLLPLKKGAPLRMADVHAAIERLYATGAYDDIQVDAEPAGADVLLRILTDNSWFIGNVAVLGRISDPPNRGQLVNATRLNLGQPFIETALAPAQIDMQRLLESNGLHETQIRPVVSYDPHTQQVSVRFVVDSGRRARLTTPLITGDPKMAPQQIINALHWRRWLIGGWRLVTQSRVNKGLDDLRSKYERTERLEATVTFEGHPVRFRYQPKPGRHRH